MRAFEKDFGIVLSIHEPVEVLARAWTTRTRQGRVVVSREECVGSVRNLSRR